MDLLSLIPAVGFLLAGVAHFAGGLRWGFEVRWLAALLLVALGLAVIFGSRDRDRPGDADGDRREAG